MVESHATALIFIDQGEGWAGDGLCHLQGTADRLDESRFPRAQLPLQAQNLLTFQKLGNGFAKLRSLRRALADYGQNVPLQWRSLPCWRVRLGAIISTLSRANKRAIGGLQRFALGAWRPIDAIALPN
jgi:hypothetical protein